MPHSKIPILMLLTVWFASSCSNPQELLYEKFVGEYSLPLAAMGYPGSRLNIIEDQGHLYLELPNQGRTKLQQTSVTHFSSSLPNTKLEFIEEDSGDISGFVISLFFGTQQYQRRSILERRKGEVYQPSQHTHVSNEFAKPVDLNDGLDTNRLSLNPIKLEYMLRLREGIERGDFGNIRSMLILQDGKLIVEQYASQWSVDKTNLLRSVTKSITSLLVGSAIDQGYIGHETDPIIKYLPEYAHLLKDGKERITIKDMLTMSAGIQWDQSGDLGSPVNMAEQLFNSSDSVAYTLSKELINKPGEVFTYSDGYAVVVGEIIKNATHSSSVKAYAEKSTLAALGIDFSNWLPISDGRDATNFGLHLYARDMAKIGQLVLNKGLWHQERILSRRWIDESTAPYVSLPQDYQWQQYGYSWWHDVLIVNGARYNISLADGFGGQYIIVVDELGLVVTITSDNYYFPYQRVMEDILTRLILPAFEKETLTRSRQIH